MIELWIARDKDFRLFLYKRKPIKGNVVFLGGSCFQLNTDDFPEVTWENSPQKVKIELIKNENV